MIITILAEPRSGSSNLLNWFGCHLDYTIAFEPIRSPSFFKEKSSKKLTYENLNDISSYTYDTPHLVIKEITNITKYHNKILDNSNKVVVLFREDYDKQLESFKYAYNTQNWFNSYVYDEKYILYQEQSVLNKSKEQIEVYKSKYFSISYEDLYYRGRIKEVINYIGDSSLNSIPFPFGKKYRLDKKQMI